MISVVNAKRNFSEMNNALPSCLHGAWRSHLKNEFLGGLKCGAGLTWDGIIGWRRPAPGPNPAAPSRRHFFVDEDVPRRPDQARCHWDLLWWTPSHLPWWRSDRAPESAGATWVSARHRASQQDRSGSTDRTTSPRSKARHRSMTGSIHKCRGISCAPEAADGGPSNLCPSARPRCPFNIARVLRYVPGFSHLNPRTGT